MSTKSIRNPNDVYYQLENLDKIRSHDYMFQNGTYTDFSITPVHKDELSGRMVRSKASTAIPIPVSADYSVFKENINPDNWLQLNVNNSQFTIDEYINLYAREYRGILDDIIYNNPNLASAPYNEEQIREFQIFVLKIVNKVSLLKGSYFCIDLILRLYAKFLGYDLISFLEDTNNPFVYRITSTLPVEYWRNNIKKLVHPMSWFDIYNIVDSKISDTTLQPFDFRKKISNTYKTQVLSYLDAEKYFLQKDTYGVYNTPNRFSFHYDNELSDYDYQWTSDTEFFPADITVVSPSGGVSPYKSDIGTPDPYNYLQNLRYMFNSDGGVNKDAVKGHDTFGRLSTPFSRIHEFNYAKFNYKPGGGMAINQDTTAIDYDIVSHPVIYDSKNLQVNLTRNALESKLDFIYNQPGYALHYKWEIFYRNVLYKCEVTPFNKVTVDLKELSNQYGMEFYKDTSVVLTLIYNTFQKKIIKFDFSSLVTSKAFNEIAQDNFWRRTFIGTRNKDLISHTPLSSMPTFNYNDISLDTFTKENINETISYVYYNDGVSASNTFEYDPIIAYSISVSSEIGQERKGTDIRLSYNPPLFGTSISIAPLLSKYRWVVKYDNSEIFTIITNLNYVDLSLTSMMAGKINLHHYKLELFVTLNTDNTEYQAYTKFFKFL